MKLKSMGRLFEKAGTKYCHEDGCYLGTCPVNCLAFLYGQHLKMGNVIMIYGDYKLIERLGK